MKSTDANPPYETHEIGTPKDYTSDMYRFYFEVGELNNEARDIIQEYLGPEKSKSLVSRSHGYECELAIQCVPDLIYLLTKDNIAIYQVIRYAKTYNKWE